MKISDSDRNILEELRGNTKDKKTFIKCSVIIMLEEGCTYELITLSHGVSLKTVQRYNNMYEQDGLDGLLQMNYLGREKKLTDSQIELLEEELDKHLYISTAEIKIYIESTFGITYSRSGMRDLLTSIGYVYKKSKIMPGKADGEKQEAFVKELELLLQSKSDSEALYFLDGCHPTHKTRPCYGWIKKGKEYKIPTNTGRQRVNINGAINAEDPTEVYTDMTASVNAQSTIRLLEQIVKNNKNKKKVYIVSDNARYYYCKVLKEWLEEHPKIIWKWLPSYSPNLNIIERLWGFMQRKILNGFYYESYLEFKSAIDYFFSDLKKYRKELNTLMTLKFQIIRWDKAVIS